MDYDREYFKGKTAVVTGAASGVGLALVEEMLKSGAAGVALADINPDNLRQQEKRLNELYGERAKGMVCDVTEEKQVQKLIEGATAHFGGRLDILFNNAGAGFTGDFMAMTNDDWKIAFDLNFYGPLYGIRHALPIMIKQGGGQIINIISGIAFMPMARQSRYAATKAALNGLALALRSEYWDDNIKVSSATPGTTATAIWGNTAAPPSAQTSEQSASRILRGVALNERVIFGDDGDVLGGANCFNPDPDIQKKVDDYLLNVARERRAGRHVI